VITLIVALFLLLQGISRAAIGILARRSEKEDRKYRREWERP